MFVSPDKHCDKEFRKVFFEKNLEMWFVDRWGNSQLYDYEEGGKYLSDTKTTLTVLDYEYLKMLEIYK